MDFASLMSAQISKTAPPPSSAPSIKYLKRSELEARREAVYVADQRAVEHARLAQLDKKRKHEDETAQRDREREDKRRRLAAESRVRREEEDEAAERARRKRLGLPDLPAKTADKDGGLVSESEENIGDEEVVAKLRAMGEPATLFGESHVQRLRRFRKLTRAPTPVLSAGPIPTTLQLVAEPEMKVDGKVPKEAQARAFLFRQLVSYFSMLLTEWEVALARRTAEVAASSQGKAAHNAMVQARENLRPLFRKLEKGEVEEGVLEPVVEIVKAAQERRYVDANDGYLRLSIGKAAWPIGVTMVGIHERSAREKLHESDKGAAHIMSDEVTRKYLQSIKRCLSFGQTRWPPDDLLQLMG